MLRGLSVYVLASLGFCAVAADPYIGYVYPCGLQAGTTNRVIVGGQGLQQVQDFFVSGTGVHVLNVQPVPNFPNPAGSQRRHLIKWLNRIANGQLEEPPLPRNAKLDEWRSNAWWAVLNTLDAGQRAIVEKDLFSKRNALQASPSLRQMVLVTLAVDATASVGVRDVIACGRNGLSAPRPFSVSKFPHVVEPLYVSPERKQPERPRVDIRNQSVILDGQILPGSTDVFHLDLAGGKSYTFSVVARELQPYIGDAVPGFFNAELVLKDSSGRVVAKADDASRFHPDPVLTVTPSADGIYSLEIHDVLYRGRADFVYAVTAGPTPAQQPRPLGMTGVVRSPGACATQIIHVSEPGPHVLEVTARRKGSPLDPVLTLRKMPGGPVLAQWDDVTNAVFSGTVPQGECDPIGVYDFTETGDYVAEVTDRTGHGGPDYVWQLDVGKATPSFEVRTTRSTLPLRRGQPLSVTFCIDRKNGFDGDVVLEFPEEIQASTTLLTVGVVRASIDLRYQGRPNSAIRAIEIFARADIGGKLRRVPVQPCNEYEQAFAWKHLIPARTFIMRGQGGGGGRGNEFASNGNPDRDLAKKKNKRRMNGGKKKKMVQ